MFARESSGHDYYHTYRVYCLAKKIAVIEKADTHIVELAALLHDIADWKFHDGDLTAGPKKAREILTEENLSEEIIQRIAAIVEKVSYKGAGVEDQMSCLEGKIVQDSDRLDAIGAIGIARTFAYGGSRGRSIYKPDEKPFFHSNFEEYKKSEGHTVNHFYEKLLLLKDRMHTETARKIAEKRHAFMQRFLEQFLAEWDQKDF